MSMRMGSTGTDQLVRHEGSQGWVGPHTSVVSSYSEMTVSLM